MWQNEKRGGGKARSCDARRSMASRDVARWGAPPGPAPLSPPHPGSPGRLVRPDPPPRLTPPRLAVPRPSPRRPTLRSLAPPRLASPRLASPRRAALRRTAPRLDSPRLVSPRLALTRPAPPRCGPPRLALPRPAPPRPDPPRAARPRALLRLGLCIYADSALSSLAASPPARATKAPRAFRLARRLACS